MHVFRSSHTHARLLTVVATASALGVTAVALAADGGSSSARTTRAASASAAAYARDDGSGAQQGYVSVSGTDSDSGRGTSVTTSTRGGDASASATARARRVTIFGDLVTADSASVAASDSGSGAVKSGRVVNLTVNGTRKGTVTSSHNYRLGGYGTLTVLDGSGRGILALRATLTRDYQQYPAGSTVKVAYAAAGARDAIVAPPPKPSKPKRPHTKPAKPKPKPSPAPSGARKPKGKPQKPKPPTLATTKGFVFPVYGKHTFSDTWGAARADTGFHEGNDIFATAGTPVVAVCDGTLNRVGTLPISGNRLWVKCTKGGDSFFYAHLSSFASDTHGRAKVTAGQVVGFVGSTGDAEQTPPHLHFEVHPGDGDAVDPYPFLRAWEHLRDVPAAAWVKRNGAGAGEQPGTLVMVRDYLDR